VGVAVRLYPKSTTPHSTAIADEGQDCKPRLPETAVVCLQISPQTNSQISVDTQVQVIGCTAWGMALPGSSSSTVARPAQQPDCSAALLEQDNGAEHLGLLQMSVKHLTKGFASREARSSAPTEASRPMPAALLLL
jgi:hypothetical protein